MNPTFRRVTQLPLTCLWNEEGELDAIRERELSADDVRDLLREGAIHFVIADCSEPLCWVPLRDCFDSWKREVQPHLTDHKNRASLEAFPGEYCYFASEWQSPEIKRLVVLEKHH